MKDEFLIYFISNRQKTQCLISIFHHCSLGELKVLQMVNTIHITFEDMILQARVCWNEMEVLQLVDTAKFVVILKNVWNNLLFVKNCQDILEESKHSYYLQNEDIKENNYKSIIFNTILLIINNSPLCEPLQNNGQCGKHNFWQKKSRWTSIFLFYSR